MYDFYNRIACLRLKHCVNQLFALSDQLLLNHQNIHCHNDSDDKIHK